jgi:hypothetical protein
MTTTIDLIRITGTVTSAPVLTLDDIVEFAVHTETGSEYLVRLPRIELGAHVAAGARVLVTGAEGWKVPARSWRHEPARTIVEAHDVQLAGLALAA